MFSDRASIVRAVIAFAVLIAASLAVVGAKVGHDTRTVAVYRPLSSNIAQSHRAVAGLDLARPLP